jgi:hypothetical protein
MFASLDFQEVVMKGLAAIGVAVLIAMAGVLWFRTTKPAAVVVKVSPLPVNPNLSTFEPAWKSGASRE